jgi:hypothetical protein
MKVMRNYVDNFLYYAHMDLFSTYIAQVQFLATIPFDLSKSKINV